MKRIGTLVLSIVLASGCMHQAINQHFAKVGASVGLIVGVMLIGAVAGATSNVTVDGARQ